VEPKAQEVHEIVEALKRDAVDQRLLGAQGVYRWYRARAAGDAVILFDASGHETERFDFPRQRDGERLCLADYVRDDADDYVALFAITCGAGVRELASGWKERGEYVRSHALQRWPSNPRRASRRCHSRMRTLGI
jgi:5-methyltetrahydrofolate--homocysteine methyltransferase